MANTCLCGKLDVHQEGGGGRKHGENKRGTSCTHLLFSVELLVLTAELLVPGASLLLRRCQFALQARHPHRVLQLRRVLGRLHLAPQLCFTPLCPPQVLLRLRQLVLHAAGVLQLVTRVGQLTLQVQHLRLQRPSALRRLLELPPRSLRVGVVLGYGVRRG